MGEIETRLGGYPGIKETAVITGGGDTDDGKDVQLYAFYAAVDEDSPLDAEEIRRYLLTYLPDYMVPSYFFSLGTIPRLSTGKIDRKSLLKLAERIKVETAFVEPRNETEKKVADIWKNMLDLEKVGVTDNFFNIGGDSIKVLSLLNSINKEFETNFKVLDLYENETIEKIAAGISDNETPGITGEYKKTLEEIEKLKERVIKDNRLPTDIEIEDLYPMSDIEKGMVFYSLKDSQTCIYHNQMVYPVKDKDFSLEIFKKTLGLMVNKHPILRTGFNMYDFEEPIQIVHKNITLPLEYEDLSGMDRGRQEQHIASILGEDRESHFNITGAEPMWRMKIFTVDSENVLIVWICHHAVTDGWSSASLLTELNNTYLELKKDADFVPRKLKSSYKDFVIEQMAWKEKPGIIEYWKRELAGYKRFEFPGGVKDGQGTPGVKNNKGRELGVELLEELNGLALKYNTSVKNLCFAAFIYMLSMVSYENDIVVGLITNIRPAVEDGEKIIGCFLNTVPVRISIPLNVRWKDFIRLVDKKLLELKKYDRLPLVEIVKITGEQQTQGKNPVSDTIFNYTDYFVYDNLKPDSVNNDISNGGETLPQVESAGETNTLFDFLIDATRGMFGFAVNYSPPAIAGEIVDTLCDCFKRILIKFVNEPEGLMEKDKVFSHEEKQTILYEWNRTGAGYPREQTIHGLFQEQGTRTPDGAAVVGNKKRSREMVQLTYRELNQKSGQLARLLREKGVQPDTIVGMMLGRSVEMIIGILGILKAGGAYLPIDADYPEERIRYMLEDSNARVLLKGNTVGPKKSEILSTKFETNPNDQNSNDRNEGTPAIVLNFEHLNFEFVPDFELRASNLSPSNLAYIIYTSGTTGKPKGVSIEHKNVVRLLFNDKFQFDFNGRDVWTMFHSYGFDFSVWEMYGALLYGGKLIVVPKMIARDPARYLRVLKDNGVTVLNQTPSAFYNLSDEEMTHEDKKLRLRYVIFGGEALTPARLGDWVKKYPRTRLVNMFGITETTVHVTYKEITHREIRLNTGNIGTPIPTLSTYIVDGNLFPLPNGAAGELCVSGEGVGRGYLNRPQLTAEKFLDCPFKTGERLYRSGDLARRLPSGDMEYLGRIDHQVQLRGFRTEPGEIENTLLGHGGIKEAAVVTTETPNGDKELTAYLVAHDPLNLEALRHYLAGKLPDYMIPSHFTRLEKLPLTANGKVDRKALTSQKGVDLERGTQYVAPGNEIEETLARIWQEVLDKEKIGVHDDYFSLGGDSIKAIRLIGRIDNICKTSLQVKDIYLYPQISSMAEYITRAGDTDTLRAAEERKRAEAEIENLKSSIMNNTGLSNGLPAGWEDFFPASDIEKLMITYNSRYSQGGMYHDQFAYQVEDDSFNFELFKKSFSLLVEKHSTLRTCYNFSDYEIPLHVIHRTLDLSGKVQYEDISHLPTPGQKTYLEDHLETDRRDPFDITVPGLWRLRVFRLNQEEHCILWIFHHAILDGWSNASLWTELSNIYYNLKNNGTCELTPLEVSYKDYVIDQQRINNSPAIKEYWRKKLAGCKRTPLPLGKSVDMARWNGEAELHTFLLDRELCRALKELSEQANTSIKDICLSAFVYLITAAANSDDITVGLVTNGRPDIEDGEKISGCFLNMIPFRLQIPGKITARDLLETVTAAAHELKSYDKLSLTEITHLLGEESSERNPVFDILLNFVEFHIYEEAHETAISREPIVEPYEGMHTFFDFLIARDGEHLHFTVRFPVKLYNEKEIEMISDYYKKILTHLVNEYEMEMPGKIKKIK
jgi:amino acid adenylation domain-containing protein